MTNLMTVAAALFAKTIAAQVPIESVRECAAPRPAWIWCDDFEEDRLGRYFEFGRREGAFRRTEGVGVGGSWGMTARWQPGQVDAGYLHLAFGKTPGRYFRSVDSGQTVRRQVYWRFYLKNHEGWIGGGGAKLTRAIVFADTGWATAAVAHLWAPGPEHLVLDPASGVSADGRLIVSRYNDPRLRWLGVAKGRAPLFRPPLLGQWHCIEAEIRLDDPGVRNGAFRVWVDGALDAERTGLAWVGGFDQYGINAIFLENYWNGGAPAAEERYFDRFVVSTEPIGCER